VAFPEHKSFRTRIKKAQLSEDQNTHPLPLPNAGNQLNWFNQLLLIKLTTCEESLNCHHNLLDSSSQDMVLKAKLTFGSAGMNSEKRGAHENRNSAFPMPCLFFGSRNQLSLMGARIWWHSRSGG
jgi:hypothetical protein